MIKSNTTINAVKQLVKDCYQKPIIVKVNLGRNKYVSFPATLSGIYPSIFTVEPDDKNYLGKTAYAYSEMLCGKVDIRLCVKADVKRQQGHNDNVPTAKINIQPHQVATKQC